MPDQRQHPRFRVRWRVAVRCDGINTYYGETIDISLGGICFLTDQNLNAGTPVQVFVQLPPKRQGKEPQVVTAKAKVLYTAFSAEHDRWRLGVQFTEFSTAERAKLEKELTQPR